MTKISNIVTQIEKFAPKSLAMDNDPIGLQIGCLDSNVQKCLVTLDVRPEVVDEAIKNDVHFIFSHHPAMFRPARNLDFNNPQNAMYAKIIKNDITVYSAHTNIDRAKYGMNDWLAERIGLKQIKPFAFEIDESGIPVGLGRKGKLPSPIVLTDFARQLRDELGLSGLRLITNNNDQLVESVGIIGGDGGKFFQQAITNNLDVFITGDVYYHTGHDMLAANLSVIDPGHHVEQIFKNTMAVKLSEWGKDLGWDVSFIPSQISTDPYQFI